MPTDRTGLVRAGTLAERNSFFLGHALAAVAKARALDRIEMQEFLNCSDSQFARLQLCKLPTSSSRHFKEEIQEIASFVGLESGQLARLVREYEATQAIVDSLNAQQQSVTLIAARDRDVEEPPRNEVSEHSIEQNDAEDNPSG